MGKLCVVIPIYKKYEDLSDFEKKSFKNTLDKMDKYDVFIVCPESLDINDYITYKVSYKKFDNAYFSNLKAYNELCFNPRFYESFNEYEYMLIAQLDAWIFNKNIEEFTSMGYDYIGCLHYTPQTGKELVNGNGGLCLRKVSSMITASKNIKRDLHNMWDWEDILYSFWYKHKLNIAPKEISFKFGWQQEADECYEKNNKELPFGCHKINHFNYYRDEIFKKIGL